MISRQSLRFRLMNFTGLMSRFFCALIVILVVACSHGDADRDDSPVLAKVGKSQLTVSELAAAIPLGLNSADSARFASAYIRRWVDSRLISDIASAEIDMRDIDRMVNDYRNRLIEMEYRRRMADAHASTDFPDDYCAIFMLLIIPISYCSVRCLKEFILRSLTMQKTLLR